jgi:hypothetical protein
VGDKPNIKTTNKEGDEVEILRSAGSFETTMWMRNCGSEGKILVEFRQRKCSFYNV